MPKPAHPRLRSARCREPSRLARHCYQWTVGDKADWDRHCQTHLSTLTSKKCGPITYCSTLIRLGYCPFCLRDDTLAASVCWQSWTRDHKLWKHVHDEHLKNRRWPSSCPHPLCDLSLDGEMGFEFHLVDDHGFSRTRPGRLTESSTDSWCSQRPRPGKLANSRHRTRQTRKLR